MGKIKDNLIKEYKKEPIKVEDVVIISENAISRYPKDNNGKISAKVVKVIDNDTFVVSCYYHSKDENITIRKKDIIGKDINNVGMNPFDDNGWQSKLRPYSYDIDSILYHVGLIDKELKQEFNINGIAIKELNNNPFIFDKHGNKLYYQRDYVWSLNDKRELIDSIYKQISCGTILIRKRSWDFLEQMAKSNEELFFYDIVDGKQRLACLIDFINDKFTDNNNYYYSDLSNRAQRKFMSSMVFNFWTLTEEATDADTLKAFIVNNHSGVQCDRNHIDKLKELYNENFQTNIL